MDFMFAFNFSFTVLGLVYFRFYSKDYLFELENTNRTGKLVQAFSLFIFLDVVCLQQLSLLTYSAVKYCTFTYI